MVMGYPQRMGYCHIHRTVIGERRALAKEVQQGDEDDCWQALSQWLDQGVAVFNLKIHLHEMQIAQVDRMGLKILYASL